MTSAKSCICYAIDDNYLFPTLVSALQARRAVAPDYADVVIVCISEASERFEIARRAAQEAGIETILVDPRDIGGFHPMYGRLFLDRILPERYEKIVYLDGDTQIRGDLTPLVEAAIPPGRFLAVRDPAVLFARALKRLQSPLEADRAAAGLEWRSYDDYFNTGVLVGNRAEWSEFSELTLDVIRQHAKAFKYGDQDPMNLAVGDRCIFISNRWNFPGFFIGSENERRTRPVVYHFMSNPRPWVFRGLPWGSEWGRPYDDLLAHHPELAPLVPKTPLKHIARYHAQQIVKYFSEYRIVAELPEKEPLLPL